MSSFKCPLCLDTSSDEDEKVVIKTKKKRVKFNDKVQIIHIEREIILPDVSWMTMARDRRRFERRFRDIEKAISWIFSTMHRRNIRKMLRLFAANVKK